jgi:hypothetical protein
MAQYLISAYLHVIMLIISIIVSPFLVGLVRKWLAKDSFTAEQNNKLRLDIATVVPIGVLLWNVLIYNIDKAYYQQAAAAAAAVQNNSAIPLTFEAAVASAGESTVALAAAVIFCRLCGAIWSDIKS